MRLFHAIKFFILLAIILMPDALLNAQSDEGAAYLRYDVDITISERGDFTVKEIQQVLYGGEFTEGFAEIPLEYVTDISGIKVYGGPDLDHLQPYEFNGVGPDTFSLAEDGETLFIDWEYAPTKAGDALTFVVEYVVEGGLWIYPESDLLEWRAVAADRGGLVVPESRVTVNLPFVIDPEALAYDAFGPANTAVTRPTTDGQQVVFSNSEPIDDGTAFQVLVEFPHGLVDAVPQAWQLAADQAELQYRIPAVDVELILDEAGKLHVSEHQQVVVEEGTMYEGFRRFNWLFLEGLDELFVQEGEVHFTYAGDAVPLSCEDCFTLSLKSRPPYWVSYSRYSDEISINDHAAGGGEVTWRFPALVKGEQATFDLEFAAIGTVSVTEEDQKLHWTILPGFDVPVERATARLVLPKRLGLEDVVIEGPGSKQVEDGAILLSLEEPATDWAIQVTLPPGTTTAEKPAWQSDMERVMDEAEAYRVRVARDKIVITSGGGLALILAVIGGLTAWYLRGSRKWREMRGNYRTTPPSELSPGLVAYLVDEKATAKGALSIVLHLATLGLVRIELKESVRLERISNQEQIGDKEVLESPTGGTSLVAPHVAFLYNSLVPDLPLGSAIPLDSLLGRLRKLLPELYTKMGQDLVTGYYQKGGLQRSGRLPKRVFAAALVIFFFIFIFMRNIWHRFFVVPLPGMELLIILMVIVMFALFAWWIVSTQRSNSLAKSAKKEAQRWLGFKVYLQDIQKYGDLAEAQEILDRYFDYAVALDVDQRLVEQVKAMGGVVPIWLSSGKLDDGMAREGSTRPVRPWYVRPWYRRGSWTPRAPGSRSTTGNAQYAAAVDGRPSLQRLSDDLNGSLLTASRGLTGVLNTAVGEGSDPVKVNISAFGSRQALEWDPDTPVDKVIGDIMRKSETIRPPRPSVSSGGGYRGGSGGSRRRGSSGGRSRSSGSRRSGGGGRRGFR